MQNSPLPSDLTATLTTQLSTRTKNVLRVIIESYMSSGEAVGSRTLSQDLARLIGLELSPATVRNIMADLETAGLLFSPHISAGRLPTDAGLRLFVDSLLEVNALDPAHQAHLEQHLSDHEYPSNPTQTLEKLSATLSSLSQCAGLVAAPKKDYPLRQVEFVQLSPGQVLAVWVAEDGQVENRLLEVDSRLTPSDLQKASNYLTYHLHGRTLAQAKESIAQDISQQRAQLDNLTCSLIEQGLALPVQNDGLLIIRGQAHLLNDIRGSAELDQIKRLFETLEQRETLFKLMEQTESANGVQIFIGSQNTLFDHTGCAMIVAPYHNKTNQLIGAIGVIGPTRMDYGRIIPMIDYTSKLLGQILSGATG